MGLTAGRRAAGPLRGAQGQRTERGRGSDAERRRHHRHRGRGRAPEPAGRRAGWRGGPRARVRRVWGAGSAGCAPRELSRGGKFSIWRRSPWSFVWRRRRPGRLHLAPHPPAPAPPPRPGPLAGPPGRGLGGATAPDGGTAGRDERTCRGGVSVGFGGRPPRGSPAPAPRAARGGRCQPRRRRPPCVPRPGAEAPAQLPARVGVRVGVPETVTNGCNVGGEARPAPAPSPPPPLPSLPLPLPQPPAASSAPLGCAHLSDRPRRPEQLDGPGPLAGGLTAFPTVCEASPRSAPAPSEEAPPPAPFFLRLALCNDVGVEGFCA